MDSRYILVKSFILTPKLQESPYKTMKDCQKLWLLINVKVSRMLLPRIFLSPEDPSWKSYFLLKSVPAQIKNVCINTQSPERLRMHAASNLGSQCFSLDLLSEDFWVRSGHPRSPKQMEGTFAHKTHGASENSLIDKQCHDFSDQRYPSYVRFVTNCSIRPNLAHLMSFGRIPNL